MASLLLVLLASAAWGQRLEALLDSGPYYGLDGKLIRLAVGPVTGGDIADVAVGDWDGDGRLDLLLGSAYGDLTLLLRDQNGLLGSPQPLMPSPVDVLGWPPEPRQASPELADWDGNGSLDLLLGLGERLYLYQRSEGHLSPGHPLLMANGRALAAQFDRESGHLAPCADDLDGDGDLDLLIGDEGGRIWWVENSGTPTAPALVAPRQLSAGGQALAVEAPARVSVGNVVGDSRKDLVIGDGSGGLWVCQGLASGFEAPHLLLQSEGQVSLRVCRWQDGKQAIILGTAAGLVRLLALQDGTVSDAGPLMGRDQPLDVGRGAVPIGVDWDRDGDTDLVVGGADGIVRYFERSGVGYMPGRPLATADGQTIVATGGYAWPCMADADSDGDLDLLLGCGDGTLRLYINSGGFADAGPVQVADGELKLPGPVSVSACDYDADGDSDLFLATSLANGEPQALLQRRVLYLENAAASHRGPPVFIKAVPLDLFTAEPDSQHLQDATTLGLRYLQVVRSRPGQTRFLAVCKAGVLSLLSSVSRQDYPVLVAAAPDGILQPLLPPLHSATLAKMDGKAGLLCGLDPYGMICFYPGILP